MIDLKKIQERFDNLFEKETEESFNNWLENKKKNEIFTFLGKGKIENIKPCTSIFIQLLIVSKSPTITSNNTNNTESNTQYSMAA